MIRCSHSVQEGLELRWCSSLLQEKIKKERTGERNECCLKPVAFTQTTPYSEDSRIIAAFLALRLLIKGNRITEDYLTYLTYGIDGRPHDLPFHWTIIPGAEKESCHCQSRSQKRAETLFQLLPSVFCGSPGQ